MLDQLSVFVLTLNLKKEYRWK